MAENTSQAAGKEKKNHWKNLKAEFRKIIWPDRKKVMKQTFAVIASAACLGLLISILDTVIMFGLGFIIK